MTREVARRAAADAERSVTIINRLGLHARAAAKFVRTAEAFEAEIFVRRGETEVSGRSLMGLMMLAAGPGTSLVLSASGDDRLAALTALEALVRRRFDEE
ncbi:MAG: HPr family phosphocarrier protein [Alphaproteobacteria bacterium]